MTSFDLVRGEHDVVLVFTVAGGLLVAGEIARWRPPALGLDLSPKRLVLAAALTAAYLLVPLAFLGAVEASDSYSVKTLREVSARPGRTVGLDRTHFVATPEGGAVEMWNGERVRVAGPVPGQDASISLYGTFLDPGLLRVDRFVVHERGRDWPSYLALLLLGVLWFRPWLPPRGRAPTAESSSPAS
jgi:hypothetical protein